MSGGSENRSSHTIPTFSNPYRNHGGPVPSTIFEVLAGVEEDLLPRSKGSRGLWSRNLRGTPGPRHALGQKGPEVCGPETLGGPWTETRQRLDHFRVPRLGVFTKENPGEKRQFGFTLVPTYRGPPEPSVALRPGVRLLTLQTLLTVLVSVLERRIRPRGPVGPTVRPQVPLHTPGSTKADGDPPLLRVRTGGGGWGEVG